MSSTTTSNIQTYTNTSEPALAKEYDSNGEIGSLRDAVESKEDFSDRE